MLLALAEELGRFVPYVGGPAWAHILLVPLETLSAVEETVVREKAVSSLAAVGAELPESSIVEHFAPLVKVRILLIEGIVNTELTQSGPMPTPPVAVIAYSYSACLQQFDMDKYDLTLGTARPI